MQRWSPILQTGLKYEQIYHSLVTFIHLQQFRLVIVEYFVKVNDDQWSVTIANMVTSCAYSRAADREHSPCRRHRLFSGRQTPLAQWHWTPFVLGREAWNASVRHYETLSTYIWPLHTDTHQHIMPCHVMYYVLADKPVIDRFSLMTRSYNTRHN